MIQIRNGIYETNSSSSHAIVIRSQGERLTPEEIKERVWLWRDGGLEIRDNWFGRSPFRILRRVEEKAAYAIAYYSFCPEKRQEIIDMVIRNIPGCEKLDFPMRHYSIHSEDDVVDYGSVDHQSEGLLTKLVNEHGVSLEEFIFNPKYQVVIDGDEYNIFGDMIDDGLINDEGIDDIIGAY